MQTNLTSYADVNTILGLLLSEIQAILGQKLVGLYVIGSLADGDFDADISDIDLIAAIATDLDERELEQLENMHTDIAHKEQTWGDRIEVCYISVADLRRYNPHYQQALASHGKPLHVTEAGPIWIIHHYVMREKGIALFGPPPERLVGPISREALMQALQERNEEWRKWLYDTEAMQARKYRTYAILTMCRALYTLKHRKIPSKQQAALWAEQELPAWASLIRRALKWRTEIMRPREYQAYAILTMCRELYTLKHGDFASKKQAALWAEKELPQWASLIRRALKWREAWRDEQIDHDAPLPETIQFVRFALNLMP